MISFEPVKENYKLLCANAALNGLDNIVAENTGLSSAATRMDMNIYDVNHGACCIRGSRDLSWAYGTESRIETANFIRLDDYIVGHSIDPDSISCIWIDTEGHEPDVILGALNTLKKTNALVYMEYNIAEYKANGKFEDFCEQLGALFREFVVYEEHNPNGKRRRIEEIKIIDSYCNILLFK